MTTLNVQRTLPPAAAPFPGRTLISALRAMVQGGDAVEAFERSICHHYGRRHCILVSSGAAALTLILSAIKKNEPTRRHVIVPAYTCYSVPASIKRAGLEIYPIDIDPVSLDFDSASLLDALERHANDILAIVPTHLFGIPSDVQQLRNLINGKEIVIIEDAAQAMGAQGSQGQLGGIGDVGFFSLGRGKAFSTMGGGVIVTDDSMMANCISEDISQCDPNGIGDGLRLMMMTLFVHIFSRPELFWLPKSLPFLKLGETIYETDFRIQNYSPFQAGLGTQWQDRLATLRAQRKINAESWHHFFRRLRIETPVAHKDHLPNLIRYPFYLSHPVKFKELLLKSRNLGLGLMPGYPDAITRIPALRAELSEYKCTKAQQVARQLITLPTHGWVTAADRHRISATISSTLGKIDSV